MKHHDWFNQHSSDGQGSQRGRRRFRGRGPAFAMHDGPSPAEGHEGPRGGHEGDRGRRGRGRRHDEGFGGPGFGGPGRGDFGGRGGFGPRGPRARRGDVRLAALLLIAEEPRNGYQLIQELAERSNGAWKPSPGAVYPALAQLVDEGLVRDVEQDGRKLFAITDEGLAETAKIADRPRPWDEAGDRAASNEGELFKAMGALMQAAKSVAMNGDPAVAEQAAALVNETRKKIYGLLAEH